MNKNELNKILNDPILKRNLYNAVNLRFDDESKINQQDYSRFIYRNFWYRMFLANPEQAKKIDEKIGGDGSFDSFYANCIEKGLFDKYYNICEKQLQTHTKWANSCFLGIKDIAGKIYLSVNNDQLYFFPNDARKL